MWDDIIIGKGEKLCSAVKCYEAKNEKTYVSENSTAYWVSNLIFGIGITIYKDSYEGIRLAKLLKKPVDTKIKQFLDMQVIKHLPYGRLMIEIENLRNDSFEKGRESKATEIRHLLGIRD